MATNAQIDANRRNAARSTGPKTETGRAIASRNHLTLGLYTRADYVKPEERDLYREFCETMLAELEPATLLEQSLAAEITGATWRLRRCSGAEAELADYALIDPLLADDEAIEKKLRSIERARASAHSLLHRSINQLRKLQTCRESGNAVAPGVSPEPSVPSLEPAPQPAETQTTETQTAQVQPAETHALASNCKTGRNHPCPCGSGLKFKRCCLRTGPAWQSSHPDEAFSITPEPTSASSL
jgi:hypothetical protein